MKFYSDSIFIWNVRHCYLICPKWYSKLEEMSRLEELLDEISDKKFNKQKFVNLAIKDPQIRDFIVESMINHPQIMKYYHCFYILEEMSMVKPELLHAYWDTFQKLLNHSNSYHRNFGLILLANITKVDEKNKIIDFIDDYLELLDDEKMMTAEECIKNAMKIASIRPELTDKIISRLIDFENSTKYSDKQKAVMLSQLIERFEWLPENYRRNSLLINFAKKHVNSISPKTRKVAKSFLSKYSNE